MPSHPLPTIAGCYYGTLTGEYETLPAGNIFTFQSTNTGADASNAATRAQTIASELANRWGEHVAPVLHTSYSGTTAKVYALQYPLSPAEEFHATNSGAISGALLSATRAVLVKHSVARRGRGSQGRSYLAPIGDAAVQPGGRLVDTDARDLIQSAFDAFIAGVLDAYNGLYPSETLRYVQLSRLSTGATYNITSSHVEIGIASQRKRGRRRDIAE